MTIKQFDNETHNIDSDLIKTKEIQNHIEADINFVRNVIHKKFHDIGPRSPPLPSKLVVTKY